MKPPGAVVKPVDASTSTTFDSTMEMLLREFWQYGGAGGGQESAEQRVFGQILPVGVCPDP